MKRLRRIIIFMLGMFLIVTKVNALENDTAILKEYVDGVYYAQVTNGNMRWSQYATFKANGEHVFCIGPGISVKSTTYSSYDNWNVTSLTTEQQNRVELIAYYGYDYPGHQTLSWYLATQKLIWETLGVDNAYFSDAGYGGGNIFNLDSYVQSIESAISDHYTNLSFNGVTLRGFVDDRFKLIETNNQLSNFTLSNNANQNVTINQNDISVIITENSNEPITFTKTSVPKTIIYKSDGSQPMAKLGITNTNVITTINIEVLSGSIKTSFNNKTKSNDVKLENAKYKIEKYKAIPGATLMDDPICIINTAVKPIIFETNSEGEAEINNLGRGMYRITQIEASQGCLKDNKEYVFIVKESSLNQEISLDREVFSNQITINKYINNNEVGTCMGESNIKFEIYQNNELIKTVITDEKGIINTELLYGNYILKQITTTEGYEKVADIDININTETEKIVTYNLISNNVNEIKSKEVIKETVIEFPIPKTSAPDLKPLFTIILVLLLGIVLIIMGLKNAK